MRKRSVGGVPERPESMTTKSEPGLVEIYRSGTALWVVVDGTPLPMGWVSRAYTAIDDDDVPYVDLTIRAERVVVDNSMYVHERDRGDVDDVDADDEMAQRSAA